MPELPVSGLRKNVKKGTVPLIHPMSLKLNPIDLICKVKYGNVSHIPKQRFALDGHNQISVYASFLSLTEVPHEIRELYPNHWTVHRHFAPQEVHNRVLASLQRILSKENNEN